MTQKEIDTLLAYLRASGFDTSDAPASLGLLGTRAPTDAEVQRGLGLEELARQCLDAA